ncbi:type II toxin-antitoxin system Phd/YefM family antitoxin [Patulibacter sp.]|uniref:type II toxin-antitoxin system Phd/YefM family antitoxin n=1 Tax=Patulibacter sp. TaxID=1912859 RepID=UPI00271F03E7|nr:type II toxin-antitoxin system Phd/YefM family antitoxin [Patulibacter sp.]MDO9410483.1 type II toxin-antitoxin system Phd/YefM family antitoxin [Patulibacter sp.]
MATMTFSAVRENLRDAVELARTEAVFIEDPDRCVAVLISPERYDELMEALEDAQDVAAIRVDES